MLKKLEKLTQGMMLLTINTLFIVILLIALFTYGQWDRMKILNHNNEVLQEKVERIEDYLSEVPLHQIRGDN